MTEYAEKEGEATSYCPSLVCRNHCAQLCGLNRLWFGKLCCQYIQWSVCNGLLWYDARVWGITNARWYLDGPFFQVVCWIVLEWTQTFPIQVELLTQEQSMQRAQTARISIRDWERLVLCIALANEPVRSAKLGSNWVWNFVCKCVCALVCVFCHLLLKAEPKYTSKPRDQERLEGFTSGVYAMQSADKERTGCLGKCWWCAENQNYCLFWCHRNRLAKENRLWQRR